MKFVMGVREFETSVPASFPYHKNTKQIQVRDKSASGISYVEDFSVEEKGLSVLFENLPNADYVGLLDWHVNIAEGMLYEFDMVDDLGESYHVRFSSPELKGTIVGHVDSGPLWALSFGLEEVK
jgi:hypothetical protein